MNLLISLATGFLLLGCVLVGLLIAGYAALIILAATVGGVVLWFLGSLIKADLEYHGLIH